jgi:hypothetical protein
MKKRLAFTWKSYLTQTFESLAKRQLRDCIKKKNEKPFEGLKFYLLDPEKSLQV